jgi:hypothetical protein
MKKSKILMMLTAFLPFLWSCHANDDVDARFKTGAYVSSLDKFESYYYKLQGCKFMGGTSMDFKQDGSFDFHFNCTKGTYHGRYEVRNDTIILSDANLALPEKFIIDNGKRIVGQTERGGVKYIYIYKFNKE